MTPRVLVVEHEHDAGPGYLGTCLASAGVELEVVRPYRGDAVPRTAIGYAGLVVLGGTPGPYDDEIATWLPAVRELMAGALARSQPMLGVCLGGELLSVVAGGRVVHASDGPEYGLHRLTPEPAARLDPLFAEVPDGAPAVEWHQEEILLPPGAVLLCGSQRYPVQAFRVGERAWGMQFHMEVLVDTARQWADHGRDDLIAAGLTFDAVTDEIERHEPELREVWGALARRWAALLHDDATRIPSREAARQR